MGDKRTDKVTDGIRETAASLPYGLTPLQEVAWGPPDREAVHTFVLDKDRYMKSVLYCNIAFMLQEGRDPYKIIEALIDMCEEKDKCFEYECLYDKRTAEEEALAGHTVMPLETALYEGVRIR
jgi:hypothetical protein